MENLSNKIFQNEFVGQFEGDTSGDRRPRQTPGVLYSTIMPTPVRQPQLLAWSAEVAARLGMAAPNEEDIQILGGNLINPSMKPYAACYAGHQFGNWAGQLGDGRAITLGEWQGPDESFYELQLKGAGPTPYSRRADGRAVLRSSIREYLMSEAMHYLGVPTTRALSLVSTGEQVIRDLFYDGHPEPEPGAIVLRVAPSFLRFGNFEMLAARQETASLQKLVNWTIDRYYAHLQGKDQVLQWFREVCERTAALMVEWLRVGFVHGVMNTDNMSILGLTIDYGPYAFLDAFDPSFTPNTTDLPGRRYAFGRQPAISHWNLGCLAGALAPLFPDTRELEEVLDNYQEVLLPKYYSMMADKLGLDGFREGDSRLFADLEHLLSTVQPDMTIFYQLLMELPDGLTAANMGMHFGPCFYREPKPMEAQALADFLERYQHRISENRISREASLQRMQKANPRFILRNYLLSQAIEEMENGRKDLFHQLQQAIKDPYSQNFDEYFVKRPDWAAQKAGCSMLSCSS